MGGRAIRERLLKNEIKFLLNNLQQLSDEVLTLRAFIFNKFGDEYNVFMQELAALDKLEESSTLSNSKQQGKNKNGDNTLSSQIDEDDVSGSSRIDFDDKEEIPVTTQNSYLELSKSVLQKSKIKKRKNPLNAEFHIEEKTNLSPLSRKQTKKIVSENVDDESDHEKDVEAQRPIVFQTKSKKMKREVLGLNNQVDMDCAEAGNIDYQNPEPTNNTVSPPSNKRVLRKRPEKSVSENKADADGKLGFNNENGASTSQFKTKNSSVSAAKQTRMSEVASSNSTPVEGEVSIFATPKICGICNAKVKPYLSEMKKHMKKHTEEETNAKKMCRSCYKVYPRPYRFKIHIQNNKCAADLEKRLQNPLGKYTCQCRFCGKVLRDNSARINHERVHNGIRPFSCNQCSKTFAWNSNLRRHKLTNHSMGNEANKFHCKLCNYGTTRCDNFKHHMEKSLLHAQRVLEANSSKSSDKAAKNS